MKHELHIGPDTFQFDHWKFHEHEHQMPAKMGKETVYMPAVVVFRREDGMEIELSPDNPHLHEKP